jgi:hypothetical protein
VGRRTIKRRSGKTAVAGKDFRLAEEIDYIQSRAAERDGRLVTVGPLVLFSTETGDACCSIPPITSLHAWRGMAIRRNCPSRKPIPVSPLDGRATIRSTATLSSSSTAILRDSPLSLVTQPTASLNGADRKISNIFG